MDGGSIGRDASMAEIRSASDALLGHTIGEIAEAELGDADPTKVKGQFGELLERYYGMGQDNDPQPDFRTVGIELKCKPLKLSYGDYFYPKEPLSVGMIDYGEVAETGCWRDIDKLQQKFLNLMIVWFVHDGDERADFPFIWWQIWSPSERFEEQIQAEYKEIRRQILDGEHLSQTVAENDILQTCPKHNYDFGSREPGSYVVDSGHPELEKPERRSWRIPSRFLIKMLADHADLNLVERGSGQYIERDRLWAQARERASDADSIEAYLQTESRQTELGHFE